MNNWIKLFDRNIDYSKITPKIVQGAVNYSIIKATEPMNLVVQVQVPEGPAYAILDNVTNQYWQNCYQDRGTALDMQIRAIPGQGVWTSVDKLVYVGA